MKPEYFYTRGPHKSGWEVHRVTEKGSKRVAGKLSKRVALERVERLNGKHR